jgi:Mn2+/Fe2+ NRAMP family transporter
MRYASYVSVLRWLTLSLFAYVATVFEVGVPWGTVAFHLVVPHVEWTAAYFTIVVAIFGTTISPISSSGRLPKRSKTRREIPPPSRF